MKITPVPCLKDNYAYLVECETTGALAVVDPSEAEPVRRALAGRKPTAIWCTHHHYDHVGGNEELGVAEVVGHASDKGRVPAQTRFVEEGDELVLGDVRARILHIPGHTTGAIAYVCTDGKGPGAVFTGDTLFVGGCGRLFEGTPAMMFTSLGKLAKLPKDTRVYCGHEYTESNLRFAAHVEPESARVKECIARAKRLRADGLPTVPGTIDDELATNPFVRAKDAEELGARRAAKDSFKG